MLQHWNEHVKQEGQWQRRHYEGYSPVPLDWTAIWRPKLKGWQGKLFNGLLNKAVPSIGLGLVCEVGEVEGERIPLLRHIIRMNKKEPSEKELKQNSLQWAAHHRDKNEVLIVDAGVEVSDLQEAGVTAYVVRVARNISPAERVASVQRAWGAAEVG